MINLHTDGMNSELSRNKHSDDEISDIINLRHMVSPFQTLWYKNLLNSKREEEGTHELADGF